jgi:hypothetical protein
MISLMQRIEELEARVREIEHNHAGQEPLCPSRYTRDPRLRLTSEEIEP